MNHACKYWTIKMKRQSLEILFKTSLTSVRINFLLSSVTSLFNKIQNKLILTSASYYTSSTPVITAIIPSSSVNRQYSRSNLSHHRATISRRIIFIIPRHYPPTLDNSMEDRRSSRIPATFSSPLLADSRSIFERSDCESLDDECYTARMIR